MTYDLTTDPSAAADRAHVGAQAAALSLVGRVHAHEKKLQARQSPDFVPPLLQAMRRDTMQAMQKIKVEPAVK